MMYASRAFLRKIVGDIRASYWFWPSLMVLGAMALSFAAQWLDRNAEIVPQGIVDFLPATLLDTQVDGARNTLSVIAQSILGVAGVMFSMTLVAVSFAAGNYGPRLIGNFMRNRGNQISLGILIATFVYCLLILRAVQNSGEGEIVSFVPQYSILIAMALALISVLTVIYYIHHVPETINVSNITSGLGHRLSRRIRALIDEHNSRDPDTLVDAPEDGLEHEVYPRYRGYLQQMEERQLADWSEERKATIVVHRSPGDYVDPTVCLASVIAPVGIADDDLDDVRAAFAIGNEPTEAQNTLFLADQLVEMLARALSPGINDPFTAIDCLNWLKGGLADALVYEGGLRPREVGRLRIEHLRFAHLFEKGFTNAAQYTRTDPLARRHHITLLRELDPLAAGEDQRLIRDLMEALEDPPDGGRGI